MSDRLSGRSLRPAPPEHVDLPHQDGCEAQALQYFAVLALRQERANHFERRVARHEYLGGVDILAQQIFAVVAIERQQNVRHVVDQDAVALLRHACVPRAQARFHPA